ncbi:xanthine dehydrogenase family protein molybdopterin-binding subunit [Kordiimonas gwangyangensis]|uniref:xanthine dehydrogenase family protein molybdopterin-binding subunit n=2 Tax=Kordiimonas gwangyangensis TaxID=288022 RepID=UPI0003695CD8|nr:molybdopterin cofactor-binding domain-containing protein [Kordiimonas gwangyangensis]
MNTHVSRRRFLQASASLGAFSVIVSKTPSLLASDTLMGGSMPPVLKVDANGYAVLCVPVPDMGQGMLTGAAQLVAEELDIALEHVRVELMSFVGSINDEGKAQFGKLHQGTGGSLAMAEVWMPLRQTAAYARSLLIDAAAREMKADKADLTTKGARVINAKTGTQITYAKLVDKVQAAAEPNLEEVALKPAAERRVIGRDRRNVASSDIVTGKPIYGIDQDVPGMLHVAIRRCPHLRGGLVSHNGKTLRGKPGIVDVIDMPRLPADPKERRLVAAGVAVVANSYWTARKAANALEIEWDGSYAMNTDSAHFMKIGMEALDSASMTETVRDGDIEGALSRASKTLEATYSHPNWAHTCMEPHSCVADVKADSAEIWVGHQFMDVAINAASEATNIPAGNIKANFYRIGTGFGRKFEKDFIQEACFLSQKLGKPVKVTWSREDEMEQDFYNHMAFYKLRGGLDASGKMNALHIRVAADGRFSSATQEIPCGLVDNYLGEWLLLPTALSTGAWRGPGSNVRSWVTQSFIDELAEAAGQDTLDFMLALFRSKATVEMKNWPNLTLDLSRHVAALEKVAEESGYRNVLPAGHGRGIAVFQTHHSLCAHVVEVAMKGEKDFRVVKVTSAIDCGLAVNPLGIRAQVESGIIDGLCAAKYGNMVFEKGVPVTNNFDTYRKLRMAEAPEEINIHILDHGDDTPRGTGETSLPPFIPALTNAIYRASGKRIRRLPIVESL